MSEKQLIDLDSLTDEEVLALGPTEVEALQEQENIIEVDAENEGEGVNNENVETTQPNSDDSSNTPDDDDDSTTKQEDESSNSESENESDPEEGKVSEPENNNEGNENSEETIIQKPEDKPEETVKNTEEGKEENKPDNKPDDSKNKKPETVDPAVMDFYSKVTATFKADGKEIQVRSAEDAIRLMQMGVNYSRRMQEMKPLRAMDAMLKQHGLDSPEKLNELIDLSKGKKEAVQKFLKDKSIDPLDLDTSEAENYQTPNYQVDPKDQAFQEAIENTLAAEGGRELIQDVNASWDDNSKEALREEPSIFQNLLDQKNSGVYGKIKAELEYQRTMGFLTDVPFLQAYHQVGDAMQKAGVFGSPTQEVQSNTTPPKVAIDTGTRKAAVKPKTTPPNPSISSIAQPSTIVSNDDGQNEPDYSSMTDEEMLNLEPPS